MNRTQYQGRWSRLVIVVALMAVVMVPAVFAQGSKEKKASQPASNKPATLSMFVNQSWYPVKSWSGPIPEEITKKTGINLDVTIATNNQQLPLMIASGSLPDLVATSTQIKRMSQPSVSIPWDTLIKKYDPSWKLPALFKALNMSSDGHYYTIRNDISTPAEWKAHQGYTPIPSAGIMVRSDIMKALGNPSVTSLSDFTKLLMQVKQKYPKMVPLVLDWPVWGLPYFQAQFGVVGGFNDLNGKLVYDLQMPQTKAMYLYLNKLYRDGLITAENYAFKQDQQSVQMAYGGKAFAIEWETQNIGPLNADAKNAGNDFSFGILPVKISKDFKAISSFAGWQGVFVTKGNKDPAGSIKLMNYLYTPQGQKLTLWGRQGTDWHWSANHNYPVFDFNYASTSELVKRGIEYWGFLIGGAVTANLAFFKPGTQYTAVGNNYAKLIQRRPDLALVVPPANSSESVILDNLKNMVKAQQTKVLLAPTQVKAAAAYDAMVAKAKQIGLVKLDAWANTKYASIKKRFKDLGINLS